MSDPNSSETVLMYLNDMLALERDLKEAVDGQAKDANVIRQSQVAAIVSEIAKGASARVTALEALSDQLGGGLGKAIKDAVATAAGTLAGLYGKVRKHPVSRMLRDDYTALSLAATAYSMLYTTAVALRSPDVATLSLRHLREVTVTVMQLSGVVPVAVVSELAEEFPKLDRTAVNHAHAALREAWAQDAKPVA